MYVNATYSDTFATKRQQLREFIDTTLRPLEGLVDRDKIITDAQWQVLRESAKDMGLCAYNVPANYGGPGLSLLEQAVVAEELGRTSQALAEFLYYVPESIYFASKSQRDAWFPELLSGTKTITLALTEPESGSNLSRLSTIAKRQNGKWIISGEKKFITRGANADYIILLARTGDSGVAARDLTAFMLTKNIPGLGTRELQAMGWWGESLDALQLDKCSVDDSMRIGNVGDGLKVLLRGVTGTRLRVAGKCVGMLEDLRDICIRHAKSRYIGSRALAEFDTVQAAIADIDVQYHAGRALLYAAGHIGDTAREGYLSHDYRNAVSRAKIYATEAAWAASDFTLQLLGALGYTAESRVERIYRDVRGYRIGEGTSEILRADIAKSILR